MKRTITVLVLLALPHMSVAAEPYATSAAHTQKNADFLPQLPTGKAWKLAWHDEFDGTKLDETKWIYRQEGQRRDG